MKFFFDENFPRLAMRLAQQLGYEVFDIRGTTEEGIDDAKLFARAQEQQAVFVTTDADYYHTVPFFFQEHHGVIVVKLAQPNGEALSKKFSWAIDFLKDRRIKNSTLLLTDNKVYFVERNK